MFPAFALVIALNLLQPAGTPPARPAPPPVSEATPVAVPPATPTALRYYTSSNRLWALEQVVSIVLLAIILFSGMSARLREWAQRIGRNWFFTIVVYFALFTIVTFVITLPLTYYEEFVRQHDYGLSNHAYVAGLWHTKRIVLWDTTIARMDDRELLFVMGHEMGDYVLGHVWQGVALSSLLIVVLLYGAYKTMGAIVARWADRFGFSDIADVASLPLLLLVTSVLSLVIAPAQLALTRHLEHEADRFGLEITQTNHSAGTAFVKLQEDALGNPWPGPLFKLWRASHPPLGERIEFSNDYHPWREGAPLRYAARFRN